MVDLAGRQHGVVARRQLLSLGLSAQQIAGRARAGRLHRYHHGVYVVGVARIGHRGRWMAAVLASGQHAVLSGESAAMLWGLIEARTGPVHVSAPGGGRRPGVSVSKAVLGADEVTSRHNIPVTTPERTLRDLAATADRSVLRRALAEAEHLRLLSADEGPRMLERSRARRGARPLRDMIASETGHLRSDLEARFVELIAAAGLPLPHSNVWLEGHLVDFHWPHHNLIAELDGFAAHGTRGRFEGDRARDAALTAAGHRVLRFTWRQVAWAQDEVRAVLGRALGVVSGA